MSLNLLSETQPEKSFILSNGKVLRNLKELEEALHMIDDEVFMSHVNILKNDFYNWIKDVYQDKELAAAVSRAGTKEELAKILSEQLSKEITASMVDPLAMKEVQIRAKGASGGKRSLKAESEIAKAIEMARGHGTTHRGHGKSISARGRKTESKTAVTETIPTISKQKKRNTSYIESSPELRHQPRISVSMIGKVKSSLIEFAIGLVIGFAAGFVISLFL